MERSTPRTGRRRGSSPWLLLVLCLAQLTALPVVSAAPLHDASEDCCCVVVERAPTEELGCCTLPEPAEAEEGERCDCRTLPDVPAEQEGAPSALCESRTVVRRLVERASFERTTCLSGWHPTRPDLGERRPPGSPPTAPARGHALEGVRLHLAHLATLRL